MPLRTEPSFDPNLILTSSGYLDDLLDVATSTNEFPVFNGAFLQYNAASGQWYPATGLSATGSLNDLVDVASTGALVGQSLIWNGTQWVPGAASGAGVGTGTLDGLTDVIVTSPQNEDVLFYNGSTWLNAPLPLNHLSGVNVVSPQQGYVLVSSGGNFVATGLRIQDLADVLTSGAHGTLADDWILHWSAGSQKWHPHPFTIEGLADSSVANPQNNQFLIHNGPSWSNTYIRTDNLVDITGYWTTPAVFETGQILIWGVRGPAQIGGMKRWMATYLQFGDLSGVNVNAVPNVGVALVYNGTGWRQGFASGAINMLSGVDVSSAQSGQQLVYKGAVEGWRPAFSGTAAVSLDALSDVAIISPISNGQWLISDGTNYVNRSGSLNDISGVLVGNLSSLGKQFLIYDGTRWINRSGVLADLSGVDTSTAIANRALISNGTTFVFGHASGAITLMSGVSVVGIGTNQGLAYDGTNFVPGYPSGSLNVMSGVSLATAPLLRQTLRYDGTNFVPNSGLTILEQSFFSGVFDAVRSGVPNTGGNITSQLQSLFNSIPDNSTLRINPGDYQITGTIFINHKRRLNIIALGARFTESPNMLWLNSGTFYFNYCTGVRFWGGEISGVADLQYVLGVASGVEASGINFEDLATDAWSTRNVVPTTFNLDNCTDFTLDGFSWRAKYRGIFANRCMHYSFVNCNFEGVSTGWLNRLDESIVNVPGIGNAQYGDIQKETTRQTFAITIIKGLDLRITNFHARQCGGMFVCGTTSSGPGQGPAAPSLIAIDNCSARNVYDNGLYLSSCEKARISNVTVVNDTGVVPWAADGMKVRGAYATFDNCYVENMHHGYGFEGRDGPNDDYWTNFTEPGYTSQGCSLINSRAVNCRTTALFTDHDDNNTTYPRDILIAYNYFYNCGAGPFGSVPTGYFAGDGFDIDTPISAFDCRRVRIIGNTIENTGAIGPDVAMYVGNRVFTGNGYQSGCEIRDNYILGCKEGIYLNEVAYARVSNNYGERIGQYNYAPFVEQSGFPSLITCNNVRNSRFVDNMLMPTGHAFILRTIPGSEFANNIIRDNDGPIILN